MEAMMYILRGLLIVVGVLLIPALIGYPIEAYRTGHFFNKEEWHMPFDPSKAWGFGFIIILLVSSLYMLGWVTK